MSLNKYLAALLSLAIAVGSAFVALPDHSPATIGQFLLLVVAVGTTFGLKLVDGKWAGLLKTGSNAVLAAGAVLVPLLATGTITSTQWIVIGLAALQAIAVEVGVNVRLDSASTPLVPVALVGTAVPGVVSAPAVIATPADPSAPAAGVPPTA